MIKYRPFADKDLKAVALLMPRIYKEFNSNEASTEKIKKFSDSIDPKKHSEKALLQKIKRPIFFVVMDGNTVTGLIRGSPID